MSDREMGIREARAELGDLVIAARTQGTVTYLTRYGDQWAAVVPLERITPDVEDTTLARTVEEGGEIWTEALRLEVHRYATGDTEVYVTGWTDGAETSPRAVERAGADAEIQEWLRGYRRRLEDEGFTGQ